MKTGQELVEDMRKGAFSLDEFLAAAPNLASEHIAALLGTAYMLWPDDEFNHLFYAVQKHKPEGVFLPFYASSEEVKRDRGVGGVFEELLAKKRKGAWSEHDVNRIIHLYVTDQFFFDEHMAALLGAIMVKGLTVEETAALTQAMADSGDHLSFPKLNEQGLVAVDKHSTGGIGDGTSLVLAPLVAATCPSVYVPMMSGRMLGHTGGTLNKLEAIPGLRVDFSKSELEAILAETHCAIFGQTDQIAPADKKIYALRDATACVANDGLIVASILSKKLAAGAKVLVQDAKYGNGAFLSDYEDCRRFAQLIVDVATQNGMKARALTTDMNEPLGMYAGTKLEVAWAVECLKGHHADSRFMHLVYRLAVEMLAQAVPLSSAPAFLSRFIKYNYSHIAYDKFMKMVTAQGGSKEAVERFAPTYPPFSLQDLAQKGLTGWDEIRRRLRPQGELKTYNVVAPAAGYVDSFDMKAIGNAVHALGDVTNPDVGVIFTRRRGDVVSEGDVLAVVLHDGKTGNPKAFNNYIHISTEPPKEGPLIRDLITPTP